MKKSMKNRVAGAAAVLHFLPFSDLEAIDLF